MPLGGLPFLSHSLLGGPAVTDIAGLIANNHSYLSMLRANFQNLQSMPPNSDQAMSLSPTTTNSSVLNPALFDLIRSPLFSKSQQSLSSGNYFIKKFWCVFLARSEKASAFV